MADEPLLDLDPRRVATETRRARAREEADREFERRRLRMLWQCVILSFVGVPFYAWSWNVADPRTASILIAAGFFISYALPFFRWLAYHIGTSDEFGR